MHSLFKTTTKHPLLQENEDYLNLLGTKIWNGSMKDAVDWVVGTAILRKPTQIAFANANNLNIAFEQSKLAEHFYQSDRVFADGSGIGLAAKMTGSTVVENVNGTDMFPLLCEEFAHSGVRVFFLGAQQSVITQMIDRLRKNYPKLDIAGYHHGFLGSNEFSNRQAIKKINQSRADVLFVAMGTPTQENWLSDYGHLIETPVKMSVGGLFDFYAKKVSRAPMWMRNSGIEWVWRTLQEPKRMWRRYLLGNPLFITRVIKEQALDWLKSACAKWFKRCFDIIVASTVLALIFPLLLLVGVAIKGESPGSILFSQNRVGKNGRLFKFWKFRSMTADAPMRKSELMEQNESSDQVLFKMKHDPRITKVGKFIRRFSIDEIPQLWNVILGDMSLVGPRPALPNEVMKYAEDDRRRLAVKPGITCFWQVNGRSELSFQKQVALDVKYIKERSFFTDLKILMMTVPAVLSGKGAY